MFDFLKKIWVFEYLFYGCEAILDLFHCVGEGQSSQLFLNSQRTDSLGSFQSYGRTSAWLTSLIPTNIS